MARPPGVDALETYLSENRIGYVLDMNPGRQGVLIPPQATALKRGKRNEWVLYRVGW